MSFVTPLRSQIESILLVVDSPVTPDAIARAVETSAADVLEVLQEIAEEYESRGQGIELRESEQGWRLYTRHENAEVVERFVLGGASTRLSRAALETLAVIAYRQPVTRAQVAAVRGVNVDGVMRTLQLRGMIVEVDPEDTGDDEHSRAHRYATTDLFLEALGIDSLDRLPDLAPLLPDVDSIEEQW
ncbi:SMC-Scp complex subunit ScpB [Corynebacterium renale]|uniref:Segregation and condensation protein B n=1 Tax=Corynebacterium renale TaxID=1724 RepID=A0A2A9DQ00_9CORY|nr:SMC-Scp complex subunit ScpB [Corynebacterium renale]PFG28768.1 segregation and condensation protein B [Corynebacterium renale]SQI25903.1 Segregation and condensation protein B [Corynebacterium renale]